MGNLSPHMLHYFCIIEPTRNSLINKASRKSSNSTRVKRQALVCWLILCVPKPLRFPVLNRAFHFLLGNIFIFSRRSFCGQLGANSVWLHPPLPPALQELLLSQLGSLTNNDHSIIWTCVFCSGLKIFFGVVFWPSCDWLIEKIKSEGTRHACTLP